jgi:Rod binding domain-containing protein
VSSAAGLPPLPAGTVLPADVRNASPADQRTYRTAMAFERVLIGQLTTAMQATVQSDDDTTDAATKTYTDMLPGTMADALTAGGGIGLAADLARSLKTQGTLS